MGYPKFPWFRMKSHGGQVREPTHPFHHKLMELVNVKGSTDKLKECHGWFARMIGIHTKSSIKPEVQPKLKWKNWGKPKQCYLGPARCCCICLANGLGRLGRCWRTHFGLSIKFISLICPMLQQMNPSTQAHVDGNRQSSHQPSVSEYMCGTYFFGSLSNSLKILYSTAFGLLKMIRWCWGPLSFSYSRLPSGQEPQTTDLKRS